MNSRFTYRAMPHFLSFTVALAATVSSTASAQLVDRQLRRPEAHSFLGASGSTTTSFSERSLVLTQAGEASFNYFVDSELDHDFLRVYVDGTQRFQMSGRNRAGRATVSIPTGTHTLRVSYEKNGTIDVGRDVAFIDKLEIEGSATDAFGFDEPNLAPAPGWTAGGFGGGWTVAPRAARRGVRRDFQAAFKGYSPNGVRSAMERQYTWPAGGTRNEISITYFVDSELDHDFFKVFVDGSEKLAVSGSQKSGRTTIGVGGAGAHTIRLEYVKDQSVDEGLDDAMVMQLEARSNQSTFEIADFSEATVGTAPDGWTKTAAADFGWVTAPGVRPEVFVLPNALATLPAIDGQREAAYAPSTKVNIRDSDSVNAERSEAELLFNFNPATLLLLHRVQGRTATLGGEQGEVIVYLDGEHQRTLQGGGGCAGNSMLPGVEDHRIRVSYQSAAGASASTVTIAQDVGTCAASAWRAATTVEALPVSAAAIEDPKDLGFVRLELSIGVPSADVVRGTFGLGIAVDSAPNVSYKWPGHDGFPLLSDDVTSWENVFLSRGSPNMRRPRHVFIDGVPRNIDP